VRRASETCATESPCSGDATFCAIDASAPRAAGGAGRSQPLPPPELAYASTSPLSRNVRRRGRRPRRTRRSPSCNPADEQTRSVPGTCGLVRRHEGAGGRRRLGRVGVRAGFRRRRRQSRKLVRRSPRSYDTDRSFGSARPDSRRRDRTRGSATTAECAGSTCRRGLGNPSLPLNHSKERPAPIERPQADSCGKRRRQPRRILVTAGTGFWARQPSEGGSLRLPRTL
jgi:hypothetical protein